MSGNYAIFMRGAHIGYAYSKEVALEAYNKADELAEILGAGRVMLVNLNTGEIVAKSKDYGV